MRTLKYILQTGKHKRGPVQTVIYPQTVSEYSKTWLSQCHKGRGWIDNIKDWSKYHLWQLTLATEDKTYVVYIHDITEHRLEEG